MPKVKTNSSAKKRFKITGTGEITFQKAFKRHILTKKSTKRKRLMAKKGKGQQRQPGFCKTSVATEVIHSNSIFQIFKLLIYATFSQCGCLQGPQKKDP